MKIERFEDIEAWKEARKLVRGIFKVTRNEKRLQHDFRFRDQITSSAVSIMANIAEGFSRKTDREFAQFMFIAKGSTAELQSHLYVALDQGMIAKMHFDDLYAQADKIARMTSGFISYLLGHKRPNQPNRHNGLKGPNQPNGHNEPNRPNRLNDPIDTTDPKDPID